MNIFQIGIELNENKPNEQGFLYSGFISIYVDETVTIEAIEGKFIERVKGKMISENKTLHSFTLAKGMQVLQKDETYRFPFELPQMPDIETYTGKNFSVFYEIEFKFELEQSSYDKLKKGVLKNIKSFFTGDKSFKQAISIVFEQDRNKYKVIEDSGNFTVKTNYFMMAIVIIPFLIVSLLLFAKGFDSAISAAIGSVVFGVMVSHVLQKILITSIIGHFSLKVIQKETETFLAIVQSGNNWKLLSNVNLKYEVIEEVIDRRGTSSSTLTHELFSSNTVVLLPNTEIREAEFSFPKRHLPMVSLKDASIKWFMKLEMETILGFKLKYDKVFSVK